MYSSDSLHSFTQNTSLKISRLQNISEQNIFSLYILFVQSVAVQWGAVQSVAVYCSAVQSVAVQCGKLQSVAVQCGAVQSVAVQCGTVQSVAVQCGTECFCAV
jgi:hypothetical protein